MEGWVTEQGYAQGERLTMRMVARVFETFDFSNDDDPYSAERIFRSLLVSAVPLEYIGNDDTCTVCYESYSATHVPVVFDTCGHQICKPCLMRMMITSLHDERMRPNALKCHHCRSCLRRAPAHRPRSTFTDGWCRCLEDQDSIMASDDDTGIEGIVTTTMAGNGPNNPITIVDDGPPGAASNLIDLTTELGKPEDPFDLTSD